VKEKKKIEKNRKKSVKSVVFNKKLSTQNSYIQLVHVFDQLIETRRQGLEKKILQTLHHKSQEEFKKTKMLHTPCFLTGHFM